MIDKLKEIKRFSDELHMSKKATDREKILAMDLFVASSRMIKELEKRGGRIEVSEMRLPHVGLDISFI